MVKQWNYFIETIDLLIKFPLKFYNCFKDENTVFRIIVCKYDVYRDFIVLQSIVSQTIIVVAIVVGDCLIVK